MLSSFVPFFEHCSRINTRHSSSRAPCAGRCPPHHHHPTSGLPQLQPSHLHLRPRRRAPETESHAVVSPGLAGRFSFVPADGRSVPPAALLFCSAGSREEAHREKELEVSPLLLAIFPPRPRTRGGGGRRGAPRPHAETNNHPHRRHGFKLPISPSVRVFGLRQKAAVTCGAEGSTQGKEASAGNRHLFAVGQRH